MKYSTVMFGKKKKNKQVLEERNSPGKVIIFFGMAMEQEKESE